MRSPQRRRANAEPLLANVMPQTLCKLLRRDCLQPLATALLRDSMSEFGHPVSVFAYAQATHIRATKFSSVNLTATLLLSPSLFRLQGSPGSPEVNISPRAPQGAPGLPRDPNQSDVPPPGLTWEPRNHSHMPPMFRSASFPRSGAQGKCQAPPPREYCPTTVFPRWLPRMQQ